MEKIDKIQKFEKVINLIEEAQDIFLVRLKKIN